MKYTLFSFLLFSAIVFINCDGLSLNTLVLENNSDYDVSVTLETGNTNEDGSIAWDTFSVYANSEKSVELDDKTIYVKGHSPSDLVEMDFQESKMKIVFTNK